MPRIRRPRSAECRSRRRARSDHDPRLRGLGRRPFVPGLRDEQGAELRHRSLRPSDRRRRPRQGAAHRQRRRGRRQRLRDGGHSRRARRPAGRPRQRLRHLHEPRATVEHRRRSGPRIQRLVRVQARDRQADLRGRGGLRLRPAGHDVLGLRHPEVEPERPRPAARIPDSPETSSRRSSRSSDAGARAA